MLVLDTDHLAELERASAVGAALRTWLEATTEEVATTIVLAEEQRRGWLALLARRADPHDLIFAYSKLQSRLTFFAEWLVLPWDARAAERFTDLRALRIRVGVMDSKIASIAMVHGATVLSRNLRDFEQVPGLRVKSWI